MCLKLFKRYSKCIDMFFPFPNCCSLVLHLYILTLCMCVCFLKRFGGLHWWGKPCQKSNLWGFPGGAVVENLPANAGDTGSSPGLGRFHMPRSNWACEPQLLSLRVWSLCSATRGRDSERPAHRDEEWPPLATTGESHSTKTKTQHSHK